MSTQIEVNAPQNNYQEEAQNKETVRELLDHSHLSETKEDKLFVLKELLGQAVILEFATIPLYLQAMWSIKDNMSPAAQSIRNVFQEEMLHMAMVCNMIVGIGGEPRIYNTTNRLSFPSGLPGGVHKELFLYLEGLTDCSLRNFMEIELPDEVVDIYDFETKELVEFGQICGEDGVIGKEEKHHDHEANATIGELYDRIKKLFIEVNPTMDVERQLAGPLSWWVMADVDSVGKAIDLIKEQGEGAEDVSPASTGMDNLAHFYRFWEIFHQKQITEIDGKFYFKDPLPRPKTYKVARIPEGGYQQQDVDSEVWYLISEFDNTYSKLVQLLEEAWSIGGRGQAALINAIEVMFKLEKYALPLMQKEIPNGNGYTYGPCFRII